MKQSVILWIAAGIITFLVGFIQNRTSSEYPISGAIGIDGQEVSFHFKKVHRDKNDFVLFMRTDIENLKGIIKWKRRNENQAWQTDTLKYSNGKLSVTIPKQEALSKIDYHILLVYDNKKYLLPENGIESVLFLGSVPLSINIHYFLTLFAGLLLAIRAGLEYFNNKPRLRLYSIFALISFFSCAMIFAPVKKVYEMGVIGKSVPPIEKIFDGWLISLIIIWIMNLILVSYTKHPRKWVLIFSILTVLIFFSQNFFIS